jgi:hypothetical protein
MARTVIVASLNPFVPPKGPTCSRVFNQQFHAVFVASMFNVSGVVKSAAVMNGSGLWLALRLAKMMNEIAVRRKRRSDAA